MSGRKAWAVRLPGFVVRGRPLVLRLLGRAGEFAELPGMGEAAERGPPGSLLPTSLLLSLQRYCISSRLTSRDQGDVPQTLS